jgi:hypothetical protein
MRLPNFIGGSYRSQSPLQGQERTINFYVEQAEVPGAYNPVALYPTPGVEVYSTVPDSTTPVRALMHQRSRLFAVIGPSLIEIHPGGTRTLRGTVVYNAKPATGTANSDAGHQLMVASGNKGYILDLETNVFTEVLPSGCFQCDMLNGFFVALDADTSTLRCSDLNNGLVWGGLRAAQRDVAPDPWRALKVVDQDLWLFGEHTSETWYNAGTAPLPFALNKSSIMQYGIHAPYSAAPLAGGVAWLSETEQGYGEVVWAKGLQPQVISTHAMQTAVEGYSRADDAVADTYQAEGHSFYILTFPSANATWVFDTATGVWHERLTWLAEENRYTAWRPLWHALAYGEHLMGDRSANTIWRMSNALNQDVDGRPIRRVRRAPMMVADEQEIRFRSFRLIAQPAVGRSSGAPADCHPCVELWLSNDGGHVFWSEGARSLGRMGEYDHATEWTRLGQSSRRVFETVMSDAVPYRISAAQVGARVLAGAF